jgi:hypothetical protein
MSTPMTTPMLLGRGYNVMKGVVSPRYVLAELSINKWREQRFLMLREILNDPKYAKSFFDTFTNKGKYVQEKSFNYFIKKTIQLNIIAQSRAEAEEIDRRADLVDEEVSTDMFMDRNRYFLLSDKQQMNTRLFSTYRDHLLNYLSDKGRRVVKETDK